MLLNACWAELYGTRHLGAIKSSVWALTVVGSALGELTVDMRAIVSGVAVGPEPGCFARTDRARRSAPRQLTHHARLHLSAQGDAPSYLRGRGAVYAMMVVLKQGGLGSGGFNFDAKVRRGSTDTVDLFYAHVGAIDTFAKALLIADKIEADGLLNAAIEERYASFKSGIGADIMSGNADLASLESWILANGEPTLKSGRQELLEGIVNRYLF